MKIRTVLALFCAVFCAVFACLSGPGQAQPLRHPVTAIPTPEYGLVYLYLPDPSHQGRSYWLWVLQKLGDPSRHGLGQITHAEVGVKSLDDPLLKAYIGRIPAGKSVQLSWQFKKSDLAHQAGLTGLQQFCKSRKIGFHTDNWLSSHSEK